MRPVGYEMPEEFSRALSLAIQRHEESEHGADWAKSAKSIRNCLNIQYSDVAAYSDVEGLFIFDENSSAQRLDILVSPKYSLRDDITTSVMLVHEVTHAIDYLANTHSAKKENRLLYGCYQMEARAFAQQLYYLNRALNQDEKNAALLKIMNGLSPELTGSHQALVQIQSQPGSDFNSQALSFVKSHPHYQKQCK